MLHFASSTISGKQSLPRRTDSLAASKIPVFTTIDEELHDIRRVQNHGQEEDLKMALSKMISRVEELTSLLKDAYKIQTDLQTELTLAKSNLQLALANNEMLEDALKRDVPGSSKDVGWRRWGAKEQRERELEDMKRRSVDSVHSLDSPGHSPQPPSAAPTEGRFFKFRFGGSSAPSPFPPSPRSSTPVMNGIQTSHLASASLPALVPTRDKDKELEELTAELERERKARKASDTAKESLESELESLSQALFEEANKMVAQERMKLAETQEELREAQLEKDALRSALRLVEAQHSPPLPTEAPSISSTYENAEPSPSETSPSDSGHTPFSPSHTRQRSSSSAVAIKSPPSTAPSSPLSSAHSVSVPHEQQPALNRSGIPDPIQVPPAPSSRPMIETSPAPSSESESTPHAIPSGISTMPESTPQSAESIYSTPSPDPDFPSLPSFSSIMSHPTQTSSIPFSFVSQRPLSYIEETESPWA